jgi:hypothetical protein
LWMTRERAEAAGWPSLSCAGDGGQAAAVAVTSQRPAGSR